jgi:broad specificity phosphatase PhoE
MTKGVLGIPVIHHHKYSFCRYYTGTSTLYRRFEESVIIERVLLVRHGQTDWNLSGRWQGTEPVALNADGWEQARLLASHLRGRPIGAIYSSDLPRALETATVIGDAVGIPPRIDVRWREFNLGIFQGYTRDEIRERFSEEWRAFHENYWDYAVPKGETRRAFQNRAYAAWQDMLAEAAGPEVVIVSHGGTIRHLLFKLFEGDPQISQIQIENTSVTTVERDGSAWRLAEVAVTSHL